MDKVVRYECGPAPYEGCEMSPDELGEWVRYEDYKRLGMHIERMRAALDDMRRERDQMNEILQKGLVSSAGIDNE